MTAAAPPLLGLLAGQAGRPTHVEHLPAQRGRTAAWPEWVPPLLVAHLARAGIAAPWAHQAEAARLAWQGRSVVVATGTASGKSLAYLLPVLSSQLGEERATALYLSPTKALAEDQLAAVCALGLPGLRLATFDGDTPHEERDWVRRHARVVLTNPDMLHRAVLPRQADWARFLRDLRYVVVDECHAYRGVFGSHVALVLRRLRRAAARFGAEPVFVLASATAAEPEATAGLLTGLAVQAVTEDASPRGERHVVLWEPPVDADGRRRSAPAEAAALLGALVTAGVRTLAFVRSRAAAESVSLGARRMLAAGSAPGPEAVAAYRGGYLAEERRDLERRLRAGQLLGLASTSALELGVDVTGLDAVVLAGWPGSTASLWQQAGRAGRGEGEALAVLVARDDPLDRFLVHHPEVLFGRPVEATVLDPANPYVLRPQLCAAAAEHPLTEGDLALFGPPAQIRSLLAEITAEGQLRARPRGWFWTHPQPPQLDLRGAGQPVRLVESGTGRLLGTVDAGSAPAQVHRGAVYLHQAEGYLVDDLDLDAGVALLHREEPGYATTAREQTDLQVVQVRAHRSAAGVTVAFGTVELTRQVVAFRRHRPTTGEVLGEQPLDLPPQRLVTQAVWCSVSAQASGLAGGAAAGAAHAAEHAAVALLPLYAGCDRRDVGALSAARHPDTEGVTVFVYDAQAGGGGFAQRAYRSWSDWLRAAREAIASCACPSGCPACVQSPSCALGNEQLDKGAAVRLLDAVLSAGLDGQSCG